MANAVVGANIEEAPIVVPIKESVIRLLSLSDSWPEPVPAEYRRRAVLLDDKGDWM